MKKALLTLSFLSTLFFLGCTGSSGAMGSHITVTGKVLVKGEVPRTFIALKVSSRQYYNLIGGLARQLRSSYQGKTVTISGRIVGEARGLGMPARLEVEEILEIQNRR